LQKSLRVTIGTVMKVDFLPVALAAVLAVTSVGARAQDADESVLDQFDGAPKPPPAKIDPPGSADLRDAMRRIAQRPTDVFALTDAGYAAVKLGDYDAAFNFFTKANGLQPSDARIKAGLAIAQVRRENPFEALSLFDQAVKLGASERSIALDRALAFDLLGNFDRAERDYQLAGGFAAPDELALRHAISLSLSGKRDEADRLLIPMLQRNDPEAWRTRALMLASRGDAREANKIALGFLSDADARQMDPYFRNMARLTPAQQAAAMHFGHFPVGAEIGSDSEPVRELAAATGARPVPATGDSRLIPAGEPLGAKAVATRVDKPAKAARKKNEKATSGVATASAQDAIAEAARAKVVTVSVAKLPTPDAARPPVRIALPVFTQQPKPAAMSQPLPSIQPQNPSPSAPEAIAQSELPPTGPAVAPVGGMPPAVERDTRVVVETVPPAQQIVRIDLPPSQPAPDAAIVAPGFESVEPVKVAATAPQSETVPVAFDPKPEPPKPEPQPAASKSFDLDALVNSIQVSDEERKPSVTPVDLKKVKPVPAAATAKVDPKTGKPDPKAAKAVANSPRIWVQVATGADAKGLAYDYRRITKKSPALFAGKDGYTAVWGKTRRLLVGPFADMKAANKWQADYRKSGGDGFVWQSGKADQLDKISGK
jgi:Flp pilus assembly protein TadD